MANFINLIPAFGQTDVARTSIVGFTIDDEYSTAQINTLAVTVAGFQAISDGNFVDGYSGGIFPSAGKYVVCIYPKSPFLDAASEVPIHLEITDGTLDSYDYSFYTYGYNPVPPAPLPPFITRACERLKPFFPPTDLGLVVAEDKGTGTEVNLSWKTAYPSDDSNFIFYNLYYSTRHDAVFDGYPDFLSTSTEATIWGLRPGELHYFGVRVAEFEPNTFTSSGLQQAGPDMFFYPEYVNLNTSIDVDDTTIIVSSTDGFPDYGIIQIDTELIYYNSIQISPPAFIVGSSGRGFGNTTASIHNDGVKIYLNMGHEDANTNVSQSNSTFQKPNYSLTYVLGDGYGPDGYRDGYDGYAFYDGYLKFRDEIIDSNTTPPGTQQNDELGEFPRFDYCGSWRTMSPQSFMQGQCRPTYFGGVQVKFDANGVRHLVKNSNVQTQTLQREELLLETTGEPFVLLKRMWTGMRCHCFMLRREHPDARCPSCFNTGFTQGFTQFFNTRRSDRRILVRVDPAIDDLNIIDRGGFEPMYEPDAWTLPYPQIKDRDIIVRFIEDTLEEWRYEVLNVTRNKIMFTQLGAQKFKMKRIPKTDIIYQFPIVRNTEPYPSSISTSVSSTPGIIAHSHEIIAPQNTNLVVFKGATLESQGHNHIIYNGIVQQVLNHTHILI